MLVLVASDERREMRRQLRGLFTSVLNSLVSKKGSPRTALTSWGCDVVVTLCRLSRETVREVSGIIALVW